MKRIAAFLILLCLIHLSKAQTDSIKLLNFQLNGQPLVRIDPVTGKANDKLPQLYRFSVMSNSLTNAVKLRFRLGTSAQSISDLLDTTAVILNDNGRMSVQLGMFTDLVLDLPSPFSGQPSNNFPKYILNIPVELDNVKSQLWRHAEVSIIDSQKKETSAAIIER